MERSKQSRSEYGHLGVRGRALPGATKLPGSVGEKLCGRRTRKHGTFEAKPACRCDLPLEHRKAKTPTLSSKNAQLRHRDVCQKMQL